MAQHGKYCKQTMKLLVNDKEISTFLISLIDVKKHLENIPFNEWTMFEAVHWWVEKRNSSEKFDKHKWKDKLAQRLRKAIDADLSIYWNKVNAEIDRIKKKNYTTINGNIDKIINKFGFEFIETKYRQSKNKNFIKSVGYHLDKKAKLVRRKEFNEVSTDCLIRNTTGNENLLTNKIDNNYPFWFIDSGYTNFLESNKKWHRLVRNHLHVSRLIDVPADRLINFKKFPDPWRSSGSKILIIEPGAFAASVFKIDIDTWKKQTEHEIRQYSDLPIVFREKTPKKTRKNLYQHLKDEDYYCVISINSNAATEAIWNGIPVITLDKHITNPISRNKLSDINNLHRPNLGGWLCMVSYSQFTFDELVDGTAVKICKQYYG